LRISESVRFPELAKRAMSQWQPISGSELTVIGESDVALDSKDRNQKQ